MPIYSSWPPAAYKPYEEIKSRQEAISEMADLCLTEGRRFKEVIEALVPIIKEQAEEIRAFCNEITEMLPRRVGRNPNWYLIASEAEELAANISMLAKDDITPALKINDTEVIWDCLEEVKRQTRLIKKELKRIPQPLKPTGLEVWEEAITKAVKRLES